MKRLLFTITLSILAFTVKGQSMFGLPAIDGPYMDRGFNLFLVLPSFMTSSHSNINRLLVENGYPYIPRGSLNYGLGMSYRWNRIEPSFDFAIGNQLRSNPALGSELLRRPINFNLNLNYILFRWDYMTIGPFVGLGLTETNLILSKPSTDNDFGSILANPSTTVNINHVSDGLLAGFSVAVQGLKQEATGIFRLKFAYRIPFNEGYTWESNFSNFSRTPLDNFPYFFIQFEMGVGGNWKKGDPWMDRY
ncbi:hypothetical protein [Mongoliibacter ruber]|uniref:Putative outer membrane protein n=1 Tax=Mongoliibacter ruber TaxID=1750599 RepID=A0A2T0WLM9_9BACT|nr:hypothetical protein [Mongoliibacter ruber]PRY87613.1 putative outer membrane protein [Mongoliibacter ruber]